MSKSRHGLGRGLDALLPDTEERTEIAIERIVARTDQPRRTFPESGLLELAHSIRQHGILQPLVVAPAGDSFTLIAGERRLRAAKIAGLAHLPVIIRSADEQDRFELALIENLQRADLTPVEEARAYGRLMAEGNLTQEDLAKQLGKSRSRIANTVRLLKLPPEIAAALEQGRLTAGHANALLAQTNEADRSRLFQLITERQLTVRQAEQWRPSKKSPAAQTPSAARPAWVGELERRLGTRVRRRGSDRGGSLVIHYDSAEQLSELIDRLSG